MLASDVPLHWTDLKHIGVSPAHYRARLAEPKDSPAMRLGRLVHTIVLGGPPSAVWEGTRRGKEWEAFRAAHEGREIVTRDEVERATKIANSVMGDPVAAPYLVGRTEHAVEWTQLGRRCATRGIDVLGNRFITDLKTTNCAEPSRFIRYARHAGYHAQLAWYRDAARTLGQEIDEAAIVAVETDAPYAVTVVRVGPAVLLDGEKLNRLWMERLLACEAADAWPAYVQSVVTWDAAASDDFSLIVDGEEIAA